MTPVEAPHAGSHRLWPTFLASAACISVIMWMGLGWHSFSNRENYVHRKADYYSSLVHGFLSGHVYMDVKADPGLDSEDPAVRLSAPKLLDASYYKGHFYLYYGVTPAALILLPYSWLTGGDLEPGFLVSPLVGLGFLFALATWLMVARDHGLRPGPLFQVAAVAVLALATAAPVLPTRQMFYEISIASGYACSMAGAFWMYRAVAGRGRPLLQLVLASLSLGLSVGCRPDLVVVIPVLGVAAFLVVRRERGTSPHGPLRAGLAALFPAAVVGACLAVYNFERFGSPFDFGFSHGQNKYSFSAAAPIARADFLWTNLRWDYLTFPSFSPYFPYVFPEAASFRPSGYQNDESIHGQFPVFLLVVFVGITAISLRRKLRLSGLAAYLGIVAWMFLAPFVTLSVLALRADRYMVDYQPELVLGTVLVASSLTAVMKAGVWRRLWVYAFATLGLFAAAFNVFAGLQEFDLFKNTRVATYHTLERVGNRPSRWLERIGVFQSGPVEMKVVFPRVASGSRVEPLLTIGTPDRSDSLYAVEHAGNQIELMADHRGFGGRRSKLLTIIPGKAYTFTIDMGAFYPPLNHPFFARYTPIQALVVKTRLSVQMDGVDVFDDKMNSYDAPPWTLEAGLNDISLTPFLPKFSGDILSVVRLPPPPPAAIHPSNGLWRIRCVLPMQTPNKTYPLLSLGLAESGTITFATIFPGNQVQFGVDEWGYGDRTSGLFKVDPQAEHVIEIFVGPLAKLADWPQEWGVSQLRQGDSGKRLVLWLDGKPVWETDLHREFDPLDPFADIGVNLQGFSSVGYYFYGPIRSDPFTGDETRDFLRRNVRPSIGGNNGLWRIRCTLPLQAVNTNFPVLSAGITGKGTLIYASILPGNKVALGFDEWSIGGSVSNPISVSDRTEHEVEVFIGSLAQSMSWPSTWGVSQRQLADSGGRIRIWLDGKLALEGHTHGMPGPANSYFEVGVNHQGFSSAQPAFSGQITPDPFVGDESREFLERNLRRH